MLVENLFSLTLRIFVGRREDFYGWCGIVDDDVQKSTSPTINNIYLFDIHSTDSSSLRSKNWDVLPNLMAACRLSAPSFFSFIVALLSVNHRTEVLGNTEKNHVSSKLSGIIIPGFASTQLRAWSVLDCPYSPLDFNPLDSVWLDTTKVAAAVVFVASILP